MATEPVNREDFSPGRSKRTAGGPPPEEVESFIRSTVESSGCDGVMLNMSGGIDSSLTAALTTAAVGRNAVYGLCQPTLSSSTTAVADATTMASRLDIPFDTIELQPVVDLFEDEIAPLIATNGDRHAIGNAVGRIRMACVYFMANARNRLVIGTTNRTERTLGYVTKYGDSAVDCAPLREWDKSTIRHHANAYDVPTEIIQKPPTAGLWAGQTDRTQLGAPYELLDPICHLLSGSDTSPKRIAEIVGCERSLAESCARRFRRTAHKRRPPRHTGRSILSGKTVCPPNTNHKTVTTLRSRLERALSRTLRTTDRSGYVVRMDGRKRSSTLAALAASAVGPNRIYGLILPCGAEGRSNEHDAVSIAETIGIPHTTVDCAPLVSRLLDVLPDRWTNGATERTLENVRERVRAVCAYYAANTTDRLVVGDLSRPAWLLGAFTKHGNGAADFLPFTGLFESELDQLARTLGLPGAIGQSVPPDCASALSTETLDQVVWQLVDVNGGIDRTATKSGLDRDQIERCARAHLESHHKRRRPRGPTSSHTPRETYFHELELLIGQC